MNSCRLMMKCEASHMKCEALHMKYKSIDTNGECKFMKCLRFICDIPFSR